MSDKYDYDLIAIGAGSGGLSVAERAAAYGAKCAVVESGKMGGTCVNVGCVPKKIMWFGANLAHAMEDAKDYGFDIESNGFDWNHLVTKREKYISGINDWYHNYLADSNIDEYQGFASFVNEHTLDVDGKKITAKQPFVAIAIESTLDGTKVPVMLHTHKTNDVAEFLIVNKLIPSLKNATVTAREVKHNNSRFDILLSMEGKDIMAEVKSCTLFHKNTAMFPDAVTSRGKKHVEELAELSKTGLNTVIIFIVHSHKVKFFCPDYHTDPEFSKALYEARKFVKIIPVSVKYNKDLSLDSKHIKELPIMWDVYKKEAVNKGAYLLSIEIKKDFLFEKVNYKKGYYMYVNHEKEDLFKIIEKHKRKKTKPLNILEELRKNSSSFKALAINTPEDIKKDLDIKIKNIADRLETDLPRRVSLPLKTGVYTISRKTP